MQKFRVKLCDQIVSIEHPSELDELINDLFGHHRVERGRAGHKVVVDTTGAGSYHFQPSSGDNAVLNRDELPEYLMEAVLRGLVTDLRAGVALHAGAVAAGRKSILVAGTSGAGKSTLTAWLVQNGFGYLTDELVVLPSDEQKAAIYFARPLTIRTDAKHVLDESHFGARAPIRTGVKLLYAGLPQPEQTDPTPGLILFPRFEKDAGLHMAPLSAGSAALRLLENNLNGRNLADGGLSTMAALAEEIPAFSLSYGDIGQLDGAVDALIRHVLETGINGKASRALFSAFGSPAPPTVIAHTEPPVQKFPVQAPTPSRGSFRLTIGMATYDDYDGVYFTIQSLRVNNAALMDQIELLIIDNNPDGVCGADLKALENASPHLRYVPYLGQSGTAVRDFIFAQASGTFVLCLDCHVLLMPGALQRFVDYIDTHPQTSDLLQGPLVYDGLDKVATHFEPVWRAGMYGAWADAEAPPDFDTEPFDIPMQGLGVFACRRDAWPGFNTKFKGFGGEEGYIHEKFRQRGNRTLCLPFLQWIHRFSRPMGIPYRPSWKERIRNYMIGFRELDLETAPIVEHFEDVIGAEETQEIIGEIETELAGSFNRFDAIFCINLDSETVRWSEMSERFGQLGIEKLVSRLPAVATPENHHIGCALSHRSVIRQARQRGLSNVLVFEDDAVFRADIDSLLPDVLDELDDVEWDILFLGGRCWGKRFDLLPGKKTLERAYRVTCGHAIAYNHTIFDRLLTDLPDNENDMKVWLEKTLAIDQYIYRLDIKKVLARPMLAMQPNILPTLPENQRSLFSI